MSQEVAAALGPLKVQVSGSLLTSVGTVGPALAALIVTGVTGGAGGPKRTRQTHVPLADWDQVGAHLALLQRIIGWLSSRDRRGLSQPRGRNVPPGR